MTSAGSAWAWLVDGEIVTLTESTIASITPGKWMRMEMTTRSQQTPSPLPRKWQWQRQHRPVSRRRESSSMRPEHHPAPHRQRRARAKLVAVSVTRPAKAPPGREAQTSGAEERETSSPVPHHGPVASPCGKKHRARAKATVKVAPRRERRAWVAADGHSRNHHSSVDGAMAEVEGPRPMAVQYPQILNAQRMLETVPHPRQ